MTQIKPPKVPTGLKASGRALWRSVSDAYELETHEVGLLLQACRITDRLDDLQAMVDRDGLMVPGPGLVPRVNPAAVEHRQQTLTLTRTLAALRMPSGDEDAGRPQRRGPRGVYSISGGTPPRSRRPA